MDEWGMWGKGEQGHCGFFFPKGNQNIIWRGRRKHLKSIVEFPRGSFSRSLQDAHHSHEAFPKACRKHTTHFANLKGRLSRVNREKDGKGPSGTGGLPPLLAQHRSNVAHAPDTCKSNALERKVCPLKQNVQHKAGRALYFNIVAKNCTTPAGWRFGLELWDALQAWPRNAAQTRARQLLCELGWLFPRSMQFLCSKLCRSFRSLFVVRGLCLVGVLKSRCLKDR